MEKREEALREALGKNDEEIKRWESYIKENETAINNLNVFTKKLTVDVMVPVGKRAFIPGRLIHTNELLVGHYQDYFSKCSAHTATEICKKRIENGKQHLERLEAEKDLFQNKLEKPYLEGVLPNVEEREIIEEYDEEKEKVWREEHRKRVKEAKLKEKEQRYEELRKENAHDELLQTLEEEDILKELNEELSGRELESGHDTKEILNKLMSGEMSLPPSKKRIAHNAVASRRDDSVQLKPIETKRSVQSMHPVTDHSVASFESKLSLQENSEFIVDGNDSDTSIASETPEEIRLIEKQAEYLSYNDRLGFLQYQLQIVDRKISTFSFTNNKELEEKMHLFKVRDHLEELIEILEEAMSAENDSQATDAAKEVEAEQIPVNPPKRRISFAVDDQMLEFRKNETVAQMMPIKSPTVEKPQRDIIRLDETMLKEEPSLQVGENDSNKLVERRQTILEKVEENLRTQSLEDVDLVNKIIKSSASTVQTLHIPYKHTTELPACYDHVKQETPRSPADLYRLHDPKKNMNTSASKESNFYLKEADRERAYVDVRSEYLSPSSAGLTNTDAQSKSILKNKSAVERETHIKESEEKPKTPQKKIKKPKAEDEYMSAYNKVVGDVVENQATEPDPLPEGNYVDMHTPKKRISRFKQLRNENK